MMTNYKRHIIIPVKDPSLGQTTNQIEAYYRAVKPGDQAAVRQTQHHHLEFLITTISDINPKRGRVYLTQGATWGGAAFYAKSGKSCFYPNGQSRLVVPTEEVLGWSTDYPDGVLLSGEMIADRRFEMCEQMKERPKPPYVWPEGSPNAKLAFILRGNRKAEG
jgi:hypothetical protein